MNQKLKDQPGHGHYPYCAMRKKQIEKSSVKILAVSAAAGALMLVCTFTGIRLGFISAVASVIGGSSYMAFLAVSWLEILLIVFLAIMNFFRSKAYGILVLIIYAALFVSALTGGRYMDVVPFLIGIVGIAASWRVFSDFADQRQLEVTEGYPFFSEIYTELTENPDYTARYEDKRNPGTLKRNHPENLRMQELSSARDNCSFLAEENKPAAMSDLFTPVKEPEPEPVCETTPEIVPEAAPEPEKKDEVKPEPETFEQKYGGKYNKKSILEESTSLFGDDYELPSIKPLYFQRLEEEKKQQEKQQQEKS